MAYPKQLPLTTVDAAEFTWTKKVGVADQTDLPEHLVSRVWADSIDRGFMVKGKRGTRLFIHARDVRDAEGDLTYEVFVCREDPSIVVHVVND